jgi:uncharacterized protein YbcC (UPF0753/DUF2309 family)
MHASEVHAETDLVGHPPDEDLHHLAEVIEHAGHLLPAQGPITVFIHHNTLHAFEDLPFTEAVKKGAAVFGCHPYWPENRYRDALRRGRIRFSELREVLEQDLGDFAIDELPCFGTRLDLRMAMLQYPLQTGPTAELVWYVAEANSLQRVRQEASAAVRARLIAETRRWVMRDLRATGEANGSGTSVRAGKPRAPASLLELLERFGESRIESWSDSEWEAFSLQALWRICCDGVRDQPVFTPPPQDPVRHRDRLLEATGVDADSLVHDLMTKFCAAFLDQGLAHWQLPQREAGFFAAFCALYRQPGGPPNSWMKGLDRTLARLQDEGVSPLESIRESLETLGVDPKQWEAYVSATLVALRGWGGMVEQIEERGDRVVHPVPQGSLVELLAVRLLLDRQAIAWTARERLGYRGPLAGLRQELHSSTHRSWPPSIEQRAFVVFQLAQVMGLSPDMLCRLDRPGWAAILGEAETFTAIERRRVFHLAYERRFYTQALDAIALRAVRPRQYEPPRFQAVFCIDEREESIRRHLEEVATDCHTYATAGFFSVPIYYRGIDDAHYVPLCPVVIRPQHWVAERAAEDLEQTHLRRAKARRALGMASHTIHNTSRSLTLGALLTSMVGVVASVPLVARTLFPRLTSRIRRRIGRFVEAPETTRLQLERTEADPGPEGGHIGFSLEEMANLGQKVLQEMGLTSGFARLFLVVGHGSCSVNNPYTSAYDCGACGGSPGGPNARALAQMLNDTRVRQLLAGRGIMIPPETHFVGCMHNTCRDDMSYFDLDLVPRSHTAEFEHAREMLEAACARDAHERSRRFVSAPLTLSFSAARQHVEGRSEDLAQVRPELGHATNALCIVAPRDTTRGLYFDRRAFLVSYEANQDDAEHSILARILGAVFPVCAGINLEYYFSCVDNHGWGSGTKLPHNVTSLVGVMDGAASDLRTGLPWQMVEIHEPVRLLFVIEVEPEAMLRMINRHQVVGRLCRNGWVRLAVIDPETRQVSVYQEGAFIPYRPEATSLPVAASSVEWYRGWREHLEFAEIDAGNPQHAARGI